MGDAVALPGVLAGFEALAGRDVALALAERLGGEDMHIPCPAALHAEHRLVRAVGEAAAHAIAARYRGETLYVPMARRALVRELSERGLGASDIARRTGLTRSTVRRYRR